MESEEHNIQLNKFKGCELIYLIKKILEEKTQLHAHNPEISKGNTVVL